MRKLLILSIALFAFACSDNAKKETPKDGAETTKKADEKKPEEKKADEKKPEEKAAADDEEELDITDTEIDELATAAAAEVTEANAEDLAAQLEKELEAELAEP